MNRIAPICYQLIFFLGIIFSTARCAVMPVLATPSVPPTPALATATLVPATSTPSVTPRAQTIEHDVTYCVIDGVELKLDLYLPPITSARLPVLLNIHGGSWSYGDKSHSDSGTDIPAMVARGYAVAAVNYRLAPQWKFPAQIRDVKCAVRFLRAHANRYHLDTKRIGVWGCSAGGHLAALLGVADKNAAFDAGEYLDESSGVQAVVTLSAPTDFTLYDPIGRAEMLNRVFDLSIDLHSVLVRASPVTYVTPNTPPFLIVQGDQDHLVIAKHGEELHQLLREAHVPSTLITVKNGKHCLPDEPDMQPTRAQVSQDLADFFDRHIK